MNNHVIKIVFNEEIKRVDEEIFSYESLIKKAAELFEISQVLHKINLFYLDNDILCEVIDTKSYLEALNGHNHEKNTNIPKFKIFLEAKNVDDMLNNLDTCSSMMVMQGNENEKFDFTSKSENQEKDVEKLDSASEGKNEKSNNSPFEEAIKFETVQDSTVKENSSFGHFSLLRYSHDAEDLEQNKHKDVKSSIISCDQIMEDFKNKQTKHDLSNFLFDTIKQNIESNSKELKEKFPFISPKVLTDIDTVVKNNFLNVKSSLEKKLDLSKSEKEQIIEKIELKEAEIKKESEDNERIKNEMGQSEKKETFSMVNLHELDSTKKDKVEYNRPCYFCKAELVQFKYVCLICSDVVLCEVCEYSHDHPTIKFKSNGISSKLDAVYMLGLVDNKLDHIQKDEGVFKRFKNSIFGSDLTCRARLFIDYEHFTMVRARPNKKFIIPICVENNSKSTLPVDTNVIVRNFNDMKHNQTELKFALGYKEVMRIDLEFVASYLNSYELEILLYHQDLKFEQEILKVKVEINNDLEEEEADEFLKDYPKLRYLPRPEKLFLRHIKKEQISDKDIMMIYCIMTNHKWSIDSALDELTS